MLRFCLHKLMGAISKIFLCDAKLSRSILEWVAMRRLGFCATLFLDFRSNVDAAGLLRGLLVDPVRWFSDWLCLDRVVDAPALQDEPTWDGDTAWLLRVSATRRRWSRMHPFRGLRSRCAKDVDWLPMAKPATINRSRIRRDCASLLGVPVAGSPHRRLRSSFFKNEEKLVWNMWERETRRRPSDRPRNREASTLGERLWYTRKVVAPLMSTKGLRKTPTSMRPRFVARSGGAGAGRGNAVGVVGISSYLVDPASSHMLVSKIKPCMSKYKQVCTVKLRMAH